MTGKELLKLWELYPEARELYEQYNDILLEDDTAWKELTDTAEDLIRKSGTELYTTVILETVRQLEILTKRRAAA
ncbi:MAG: hypothetical protein Q4Q33_00505 [Eubacteriales bacterium]|nr:hypothetical protein [Eubacteriales bacterium]